ncbi:inactive peptidyl-prolyl cis-trans isomerase FKBP6 [Folsomia candida]|uniref:peptidylprolyl isomerase n=1 Tax=Folsomia candida TaxID=158441 RepID=A0A226EVQ8_FOLCA|nr:inactive peptidyl-prolyl cis-trans isomerase FKBP6 [Folsomia candida]OXA61672.1 Inactive peptidyl-prolyl cis-trans isomerase FKBP6 [Folsomia candida]
MDASSILPSFKQPIRLRELVDSKRVIFEIDKSNLDSDMVLEDDDNATGGYDEDEGPVTDIDPQRYAAREKRRGLLQSYGIDPQINFISFYEEDKMAEMKNLVECGAVRKTIIREGQGPLVPQNCKVFLHYIISGNGLDDPFDSTIMQGYPQCLDLRQPEVIPGLLVAIQSMHIREVAKVWIRSDYAYGALGCPPRIPENLDVFCILEILDLIEENQLKLVPYMTSDERGLLEFREIFDAAKDLRAIANGLYVGAAWWPAVKKYRKAINILEDYGTQTQDDQKQREQFLYTLYMNLSACYLKLGRPQQVCTACKLALRSAEFSKQTVDAKLYFRFAEGKLMLGAGKDAKNLNQEALRRDPTDTAILDQKKRIEADIEHDRLTTKLTYTKIGKAFCSSERTDT